MSNMFSGKKDKKIPQTLSECTRADDTVSNLHIWSERLENWGQVLFVILIIVGIISTISATIEMADVDEDLVFSTLIGSAASWSLYAFIEYCAYHVLALLISALASITQHTIITANVALFEATKDAKDSYATASSREDEGAENNQTKPKDEPFVWSFVNETTAVAAGENNIRCTNCRCIQFKGNTVCRQCGAKFI